MLIAISVHLRPLILLLYTKNRSSRLSRLEYIFIPLILLITIDYYIVIMIDHAYRVYIYTPDTINYCIVINRAYRVHIINHMYISTPLISLIIIKYTLKNAYLLVILMILIIVIILITIFSVIILIILKITVFP